MKTKLILLTAAVAIAPCVANAKLLVTKDSPIGTKCFDADSMTGEGYEITVQKIIGLDGFAEYFDKLSGIECMMTPHQTGIPCYLDISGNTVTFCGYGIGECSGAPNGRSEISLWKKIGNGVVRRDFTSYSYTYTPSQSGSPSVPCYERLVDSYSEYGCETGYYTTATSGSASMTCTICPANASCAGTDGIITNFKCRQGYYKDGTGCTRCPSSGGIYGTTESTGATSITECYLPSGSTGTDSTGTFTVTDNCYWTN